MTERLKKIPFISPLMAWVYRMYKLPGRFHDLNDLFWKLQDRTAQTESAIKDIAINLDSLKSQISILSRDFEMLQYELKKKAGLNSQETVKDIAALPLTSETYLYFAFENKFRGSKEDIRKNQLQYTQPILKAFEDSKAEMLIDIGCGRGEFIKLMREKGVPARGIDNTRSMLDSCLEDKLDIQISDALKYMKNIRDGSLIGVTAFQVVEHLPVEYLTELIKAAFTKIAVGGIIILETVNPGSFSSLKNFYLDLTHKNPIPSDTLKFLVEVSGFKDVQVRYSSPIPDHLKLQGTDDNTAKLNQLLFGPQDYAVIGWK